MRREGREVSIREGPEELTLQDRWRPPLVDADWHAFYQAIYKGIERRDWEELSDHYEEMSWAACVKKPNGSQKAKALWKMKAAKDIGEEFYDPERKDNLLVRNETRLELWEERLKDPTVALDKALKCVKNSCQGVSRPEAPWNWSSMA